MMWRRKQSEAVMARKEEKMPIQSTVDLGGSEIFYMILHGGYISLCHVQTHTMYHGKNDS